MARLKSRIPEIIAELNPAVSSALETAADLVEARAKDRVPVDTGRLRDAIHTAYSVEKGRILAWVVAGNNEAWYGHIVEHGGAHTPPHPFLVPSLEDSRQEIERDVAEVVKRVSE
jgi:HK97 gp10 family phage protein